MHGRWGMTSPREAGAAGWNPQIGDCVAAEANATAVAAAVAAVVIVEALGFCCKRTQAKMKSTTGMTVIRAEENADCKRGQIWSYASDPLPN